MDKEYKQDVHAYYPKWINSAIRVESFRMKICDSTEVEPFIGSYSIQTPCIKKRSGEEKNFTVTYENDLDYWADPRDHPCIYG